MNNLIEYSPEERFDYFVRRCADFQEVWGLATECDNWIIFKDADGEEVFPLWPHQELAQECMFQEHRDIGAGPQRIELTSFLQKCAPDMDQQGVRFGVFYDRARIGIAVEAKLLKEALTNEIRNIWQ